MQISLVTGGAGFIGSHLVESLLAEGKKVRVLDDLSTGNLHNLEAVKNDVEIIQGSVVDPAAVKSSVQGCEVVYHLAALPSVTLSVEQPLLSHEVCATGTLNVLDESRKTNVRRVVFAASSSAYGNAEGAIRKEDDLLWPMSPYAAAKLAGEHYCRAFTDSFGLETTRVRFFNIFGPRQDPKSPYSGVIALFITALLEGRTPKIFGDGLQTRDFVPVANAVQALRKAADAPAAVGNVYNIGNGGSITILQLVEHLNHLLGTQIQPIHEAPRVGDVRFSEADISRTRRDLGFEPTVSFIEGLRRTIEYYQIR